MTQVSPFHAGIGEEELHSAAPLVRSLVVERLEKIWRTCEPHISGEAGKPDPRFVEAGIRVLDRLMRLYRLDAPAQAMEAPMEQASRVDLVEAALQALEARVAGPSS